MYRSSKAYSNTTEVATMPRALPKEVAMFEEYPNYRWTLEEGFQQFLRSCDIKNLRPATIQDYINGFKRFSIFYSEHCTWATYCGNITKRDIEDYNLYLKGTGIKSTSINTYLRNIRTFLNFLFENDACYPFKIKLIKEDLPVKDNYTDAELMKLLQKPNLKTTSFSQFRNWTIINFLLGTGVRAQTLLNVKNSDIDFDSNRIHLGYMKNRKAYIIPLSVRLSEVLTEYMDHRKGEYNDRLFCTEEGEPLTLEGLKSAIQRYNNGMGVDKTSIHLFRHTFSKKAVNRGMDVFSLQKMLGHSDLTVSRRYVEMFSDDLQKDFSQYNPLDTLGMDQPNTIKTKKIKMNR